MDIELEKLKKLEEALSDCVDILRDCQVDKTCDNCKHSDLPRGYEPCVYCRNKDDWESKESPCPCEDGKKEYRPYVTVDQFIQDFQERFPTAVPRPAHTMPLIWLTNKVSEDIHLVTGFYMTDENENEKGVCIRGIFWSFRELFGSWIFLDGSPCGKEC